MKKKIYLLDCTLRDGGYYNQWSFKDELVKEYISFLNKSSIQYIEIGFRFNKNFHLNLGKYAYSNDSLIAKLKVNSKIKIATMINAKDYYKNNVFLINDLKNNFLSKKNSKVDLVRIAINFSDFKKAYKISLLLKNKGYKVALNLMQSHNKSIKQIENLCKEIKKWNTISILYVADTLGVMSPEYVKILSSTLKKNWQSNLGIHAHNNKSMAYINSITAIKNGFNFCDSTITGMGRGAGNLQTEIMLNDKLFNNQKQNLNNLNNLLNKFNHLKQKYDWGPNFFYHYAANNYIHPTYVQMLINDKRYSSNQIYDALKILSKKKKNLFSENSLKEAIYGNNKKIQGSWSPKKLFKDKDILIIGSGDSTKQKLFKIKSFIKKRKPLVLALNINLNIDKKLVDAFVVSDPKRAILEISKFKKIYGSKIILPQKKMSQIIKSTKKIKFLDYDLLINNEKTTFIGETGCSLINSLALNYALAISFSGQSKKIYLAGFDGYKSKNKNEEINELFRIYKKINSKVKINFITPSKYKII